MNSQKYSREYLINLPIEMRRHHIENACRDKVQYVLAAARQGKTQCLIPFPETPRGIAIGSSHLYQQPPSKEEMIDYFTEVFPDCRITYEEKWIEVTPGRKELKNGIQIDWN